jgi:hypothetical protein
MVVRRSGPCLGTSHLARGSLLEPDIDLTSFSSSLIMHVSILYCGSKAFVSSSYYMPPTKASFQFQFCLGDCDVDSWKQTIVIGRPRRSSHMRRSNKDDRPWLER